MSTGKPIAEWVEMRGHSCVTCGDVARECPVDANEWGCAKCGRSSRSLLEKFSRDLPLAVSSDPPVPDAVKDEIRRERIGWLRSLASDFERAVEQLTLAEGDGLGVEWGSPIDPDAVAKCLREVRALADELEAELMPPELPPTAVENVPLDGYEDNVPF